MNRTVRPPSRPARRRHCFGPTIWERLRKDYVAGDSPEVVSLRYGPSVASVRRRAWLGGWMAERDAEILARRDAELAKIEAAKAEAEAAGAEVEAEIAASPMTPRDAARAIMEEAVRLARLGRISEAAAAARAAEIMARAAERLADLTAAPGLRGGSVDPAGEDQDDEAAFEAVRRKVLGWAAEASLPRQED